MPNSAVWMAKGNLHAYGAQKAGLEGNEILMHSSTPQWDQKEHSDKFYYATVKNFNNFVQKDSY